jgi:hypothetical protein
MQCSGALAKALLPRLNFSVVEKATFWSPRPASTNSVFDLRTLLVSIFRIFDYLNCHRSIYTAIGLKFSFLSRAFVQYLVFDGDAFKC